LPEKIDVIEQFEESSEEEKAEVEIEPKKGDDLQALAFESEQTNL